MGFQIPQSLKGAIQAGKTVPFVGAGLSLTVLRKGTDEKLFCSWHNLLLEAAEKLEQEHKTDDATLIRAELKRNRDGAYYRAAEIAIDGIGQRAFYYFLSEKFDKQQNKTEPSSLDTAKLVWQLNSQLVITTNYDKVLQWASPSQDTKSINIDAHFELQQLCENTPTTNSVLHLHGSVDNIGKIILTPDGYKALYGDEFTRAQHQAALTTLKTLLVSKTFIFIGFSFADQTFYNQLKIISDIFDGSNPQHFVLCRQSQKAAIDSLKLPLQTVCYNNHEDLPKLLNELSQYAQASEQTPQIEQNANETASQSTAATPTQKPDVNHNVFFVPFRPKGKGVIGHEQTLIDLHQQLVDGKQTTIGHARGFQGIGGVGKTQLAIEYAYNYQSHYPKGVIWLTADQDINPQLIACAKHANWVNKNSEDKDILNIAIHRLKSYSDCLIIFDNVETLKDIKAFLPNVNAKPHLLLTSREYIKGFEVLKLDSLSTEHALTLLCSEAGKHISELDGRERQAATALCHHLGQLPLALEIAGAHIKRRTRYTFAKYLQTYEQNFAQATKDVDFDSFTKHEQCLISTLKLSDDITQQHPTLINIMKVLAYSANAPMSEALLAQMLYGNTNQPPIEFEQSLNIGIELNLITLGSDQQNPSYSLHRLVKRVQLELTPFKNNLDLCQQLANNLIEWFKNIRKGFEHLSLFQQQQPHLEAWATQANKQQWQQQAALIWLQAYPYYHLGQYQQAKQLLQQAQIAHDGFEQLEQSELTANLLNDYGGVLRELGDHQHAFNCCQQALNLRLKLFGENHRDVATSYNDLGICCNSLGQYEQALENHNKALNLRLKLFGENHQDVATSYNNLGNYYYSLGQYEQALEYHNKALNLRLKLFDENHPNIALSYGNLGSCYRVLNQLEQALNYEQKALKIRLNLFGEQHPRAALSYAKLGEYHYQQNQFETALNYQQKAFKLRLELLGPQHPDTYRGFVNKQHTLIALKYFEEAEKAINHYHHQLPEKHKFQKEINKEEKYLNVKAAK